MQHVRRVTKVEKVWEARDPDVAVLNYQVLTGIPYGTKAPSKSKT